MAEKAHNPVTNWKGKRQLCQNQTKQKYSQLPAYSANKVPTKK